MKLITYGDHLRARRLDLGFLQKQVADQIGVDECTISNWESNRLEPAVRFIPRIIRFLGYCPYTLGLPFSDKLKHWRQGLGFSQERMAKALGVDEGTLRWWEVGRRQLAEKYVKIVKDFMLNQAD